MIDPFVLHSLSTPPVVRIHLHPNGSLLLQKEPIEQQNSADKSASYSIPIEIIDDSNKKTQILLKNEEQKMLERASYLIAEPIPYARFIYNVNWI